MKKVTVNEAVRITLGLLMLSLALLYANGVSAATKFGTGVFPDPRPIEHKLVRGESTQADVKRLIGIPSGGGGALLPGYGDKRETLEPYDVWYYEDVGYDMSSGEGAMVMDMRQQILMIFFKGGKFHGYFWTSNTGTVEAE
jgi:hypothetical protein